MSKFVCLECGCVFDEEDITRWKEDRGEYWGSSCYEEFSGSPCCKEAYVEAHKCDICGNWITDTYVKTDDGKRFCNNCYRVVDLEDDII